MGARQFAVGEETTVGTPVTPDHFYEAISESVETEIGFESLATIRAFSTLAVTENNRLVRGDVEMLANYDEIGLLFKHLIGSVLTTAGSPNSHTFPHDTTGIPSTDRIGLGLTLEFQRDGALVWTYPGAKITGLTHTFSTDQASRMSLSFLAGQAAESTSGSPTSPSFPTFLPMLPKEVNVTFGGVAIPATSVTLTVANPLDEPFILGQTTFGREPDRSDVLKVTLTVDALFDNFTDLYSKFPAGSTDLDVSVQAAETTSSLTYNLDKCRILKATPHAAGRERLKATYELEAFFNSAVTENLQIVLLNNDATP